MESTGPEERISGYGWDTSSFFYPDTSRSTGLFLIALVLAVLHFDELLGLHDSTAVVGGVLPAEFAYQLFWVVLNIGFAGLLYYYWPAPEDAHGGRDG